MKISLLGLCLVLFLPFISFCQLQSPNDYLPHKVGESFTPHHMLVDYYKHVASKSDRVVLEEYGETYEGRPMILAYVSSPENIKNLDAIRKNNLSNAGIGQVKSIDIQNKSIVWLSFSIHGNEAAGSESSLNVIHSLADMSNKQTGNWLENTIVILEPSVNPDGNSRYTNWQRSIAPKSVNSNFDDIEHHEPWPGGRTNHYYFDLNRDWAWQTQVESQQRMAKFHSWLPHVLADIHEMGHNNHYYFAPAAKPMHKYITDWQKDFQTTIGKNHAEYFDKNGWLYFTKEVYDLFYPSYGDTYPTFNGAIGMTYEQGGSGRAGRAVETENGEILTLKDRVDHHTTAALSTVEITSENTEAVVENFKKFYSESKQNPPGKYRSYIIKGSNDQSSILALTKLLDKQHIQYGLSNSSKTLKAYSYNLQKESSLNLEKNDLIISANQNKAVLTQVLMDPESQLEDSLTYDITAWALPYAFGLEAYATTDKLESKGMKFSETEFNQNVPDAYAFMIRHQGRESEKLVGRLLQYGLTLKRVNKLMKVGGEDFGPGTFFLTKADNRSKGDIKKILTNELEKIKIEVIPVKTGFVDEGSDLGSNEHTIVENPNVLCLNGDGVSATSFGQVKYYFDQVMSYPLTVASVDRFRKVELDKYNTLILPNGRYRFSDSESESLSDWIEDGGKLIAIGNATKVFADEEGYALKEFIDEDAKVKAEEDKKSFELASRYHHYSELERTSIASYIPGAIVKMKVDNTHPLAFGLGDTYFSLKTNSLAFPLMVNAENVGYVNGNVEYIGFIGHRAKTKLKDTISFAVENKGDGSIIYLIDDPLFRCFWHKGFRLFSNAIFF